MASGVLTIESSFAAVDFAVLSTGAGAWLDIGRAVGSVGAAGARNDFAGALTAAPNLVGGGVPTPSPCVCRILPVSGATGSAEACPMTRPPPSIKAEAAPPTIKRAIT